MNRLRATLLLFFLVAVFSVGAVDPSSRSSHFELGINGLSSAESFWGRENISFHRDLDTGSWYLRARLPKGSIDPGSTAQRGTPRGGAGFKLRVIRPGATSAVLSYQVRFADNFDFVRGGKLPGLFGGRGNAGGQIPTGSDGFSFRLMWGRNGVGTVYAYLPSSLRNGTNLLHGAFHFVPGKWHAIRQEVILNDPGESNGVVRMWFDDRFVGEVPDLKIRTMDDLKIEGMFFDVFFGGHDDSWASSRDTHIDFANIAIHATNP